MKKLYVQIIFALALAAGAASAKGHPRIQIEVLGTDTSAQPFYRYSANQYGAYAHLGVIRSAEVDAVLPDGRHVTLSCRQGGIHKCMTLDAGTYDAEIDGNSIWVIGHQLDGKEIRVKYQSVAPGQR